MRLPTNWPVIIKRGGSNVRIYRHSNRKGDRRYEEFKVASYGLNGKRKLVTFSRFENAKIAAEDIASSFSTGNVDAITLTGKSAAAYARALESIRTTSAELDLAASEFARAWEILGGGSIIEAARYYAKRHPTKMPHKMVSEVVAEFIEAKTRAGKSADYLCDIRSRCGKFGEAFKICIIDLTGADIRNWLQSLNVGPRTANNYRSLLGTLLNFAKGRGYLPKDHDEFSAVETMEEPEGEITLYTAAELLEIVARAHIYFVPFIVIGAFAGLRSAEIERLDWKEINLSEGFIEVKAAKAKTASRRIVPILPNLAKWLAPYARPLGPVIPFKDFGHQQRELCRELKDTSGNVTRAACKWKINALRHSFISYRVMAIKDVPQVALEAGNSPRMVFTNYRQLVTEATANNWFAIEPKTSDSAIATS